MSDTSDPSDMATLREEQNFQVALSNLKASAVKLLPKGSCYNCCEPVGEVLFCCGECREDWDMREAVRKKTFAR